MKKPSEIFEGKDAERRFKELINNIPQEIEPATQEIIQSFIGELLKTEKDNWLGSDAGKVYQDYKTVENQIKQEILDLIEYERWEDRHTKEQSLNNIRNKIMKGGVGF